MILFLVSPRTVVHSLCHCKCAAEAEGFTSSLIVDTDLLIYDICEMTTSYICWIYLYLNSKRQIHDIYWTNLE